MNKLLHAREIATTVSHVPPHAQTFIQTELSLRPISVCRRSCSNTLIGLKRHAISPPQDAIVSFKAITPIHIELCVYMRRVIRAVCRVALDLSIILIGRKTKTSWLLQQDLCGSA